MTTATSTDQRAIAFEYAADLRDPSKGMECQDVQVFRYTSRANNYDERDPRSYIAYSGYAVRFSTTDAEDARINAGTRATSKFHDRSLVLFADHDGIPMARLWPHGRIIADFQDGSGGEVVPMWLGWRSPFENSPKYDPDRVLAGFKRPTGNLSSWPDGPLAYFHVVLTPEPETRFTRGPEPAAMTDR